MRRKAVSDKEAEHAEKTEQFADVIPRLFSCMKEEREKTYRYHLMACHWEEIVGEAVAAHVRPIRMDFKKLFLSVDAPVWSNELRYMERQIVDKINAFVCAELATSIGFCAPGSDSFKVGKTEETENTVKKIEPLEEERKTAESAVAEIEDEELRNAVSKAYAQNLALRRTRMKEKWHPCAVCGKIVPPDEKMCPFCEREKKEKTISAVSRLLIREPWLRVKEAAKIIGCSSDVVVESRSLLLQKMISRAKKEDEMGENAKALVMLFASVKPEELTEEVMKKYLKRLRFDLYSEENAETKEMKSVS